MNSRRWFRSAAVLALIVLASAAYAQPRAIDTKKSTMTVRVYKSGVFSTFGHDHEISAPIASGSVDAAAHGVELHVHAAALRVRDPGTSEKDRAQIQKTMDSEVLDLEHHPDIEFRATSAESSGSGTWTVRGDLTLHGQTRPVTVEVREENGRYLGSARFRQSEFGIEPVKIAGGTIKVKDEVRIEFDIQLTH